MCEDKSGYTANNKLCNESQQSKLQLWLTQKGKKSEDNRNASGPLCAEDILSETAVNLE